MFTLGKVKKINSVMKILFIAPLPPPINGHSLVCKVLHDSLLTGNSVYTVDLKKQGLKDGKISTKRIFEIFRVFCEVSQKKKNSDVVYLTISESLAGNLKDIIIYLICYSLLPKFFIHLHGGSIKRLLFDKFSLLFIINRFFIKRMAGVIISGNSHLEIFESYVEANRIFIIPNFAPNQMFIPKQNFAKKYSPIQNKLKILFLSNMIPQKGYLLLLEAFQKLDKKIKAKIHLSFAGRFDSEEELQYFERKIESDANITYHGMVSDEKKRELFQDAHIFILPTMFLEGQPVAILEAYASGCVVVTTGQSGILDVFTNEENGFQIEPNSISSIMQIFGKLANIYKMGNLKKIASYNLALASKEYRESHYTDRIKRTLGAVE